MELSELYTKKGEIITQLEILQNNLKLVNEEIFKQLQKPAPQPVPDENT